MMGEKEPSGTSFECPSNTPKEKKNLSFPCITDSLVHVLRIDAVLYLPELLIPASPVKDLVRLLLVKT